VREVAERLGHFTGRPDLLAFGARPARAGDPPSVYADVSRLRESGFRPRFNLDAGLRAMVEDLRARLVRSA
jgi:nucleoside-diphosphate-sugar epimerase